MVAFKFGYRATFTLYGEHHTERVELLREYRIPMTTRRRVANPTDDTADLQATTYRVGNHMFVRVIQLCYCLVTNDTIHAAYLHLDRNADFGEQPFPRRDGPPQYVLVTASEDSSLGPPVGFAHAVKACASARVPHRPPLSSQ